MVHTKPRFGGGINMDHNKMSQLVSTRQEPVKREETAIKTIQVEDCTSIQQTRGEDSPCRSSLKSTDDDVVQSREKQLQRVESHIPEFSSRTEKARSEDYAVCDQIREEYDVYTPSEDKERSCGNKDELVVPQQKENLTRMKKLIDDLETVGITAKPKLYTKLSTDQKQLWFQYFNDIATGMFSNKFQFQQNCSPNSELAISDVQIVYCKNLFLKDKKGQFYLVIAEESCSVDLKQLKQQLSVSRNLSFADEKTLGSILLCKSGEVTPFAVMHESARDVRVMIHESLSIVLDDSFSMAFHPFSPFLQIEVTFSELSLYFSHYGKELELLGQKKETLAATNHCKHTVKLAKKPKENIEKMKQHHPSQSRFNFPSVQGKMASLQEKMNDSCSKEITADYFLRHTRDDKENKLQDTQRTDDGNSTQDTQTNKEENQSESLSPYEKYVEKEAAKVKITKKYMVKNYERKGKLKSYISKNTGRCDENMSNETENVSLRNSSLADNEKEDEQGFTLMKSQSNDKKTVIIDKFNDKDQRAVSLDKFSPKLMLSEIDDFYNALSYHTISYRELDIALTTSIDIGPSLGVKCHLLKDRNKVRNYFLVICHEMYELDYGRLKKALHPKKRLDECDADDVIDILGVDQHHLTPFAFMNPRAMRNNVRVFFTEKIMPSNVIFCIQHPFASGKRIVMTSDALKCLIEKFSSSSIGVVEEKVWVEKYNQIFTRFDAMDSEEIDHPGMNGNTVGPPMPSNSSALQNGGIKHKGKMNKNEDTKRVDVASPSNLVNCVHSFLNQVMINLEYYIPWKNSEDMELACAGTSVDEEGFKHDRKNESFSLNLRKKFVLRKEAGSNQEVHVSDEELLSSHQPEDGLEGLTESSTVYKLEKKFQLEQIGVGDFKDDEDINPMFHSLIEIEMKISIKDIRHHLDEYSIGYHMSMKKDESDDEDKDDDTTSQICHTLYLMDELGEDHYIIVGRESEHVPIKRFRRRFQLKKRVFVASENDRFFGSNPFSTFLSIKQHWSENSNGGVPKVKFHLVLYTSIYMDPEMECIFVLNHTGTSVCLSSEEFENYGKQVGMDVWYMP